MYFVHNITFSIQFSLPHTFVELTCFQQPNPPTTPTNSQFLPNLLILPTISCFIMAEYDPYPALLQL